VKAGWEVKPLGEVCEVVAGQSPKGSAYNDTGEGLPFYQGKKDFTDRYIAEPNTWTSQTTKEAVAGDILMSVRAPVGPINEATQRICIGRGLAAIRPNEQIEKDYLWYGLLWKQPEISGHEGAVFSSINKAGIEALSVPIPPLEEQKQIVAVLDAAFEGLTRAKENAETNLQNARELFESTVSDLLSHPANNWELGKLVDYCEKITVGHVGPMATKYVDGGVPFLRSQNVRPFKIDLENVKFIDDEFHKELKKSELCPGDVAIVRTGYPGTCAVIPSDLPVANCADLVIAKTGPKLNPHFLSLLLNSDYGKGLVAGASVGAAQKHFNVGAAKQAEFYFPPVCVQEELVDKLNVARNDLASLEDISIAKLTDIADLRQSLLQKAFAGELT